MMLKIPKLNKGYIRPIPYEFPSLEEALLERMDIGQVINTNQRYSASALSLQVIQDYEIEMRNYFNRRIND